MRWSSFWVIGEGAPHWDDVKGNIQGDFEISARYVAPILSFETVVVPTSLDWLAYTDHNDSVFLVGEWLIDTVKDLWPGWEQHIWSSPFYEHPTEDVCDDRAWWERGQSED